MAIIKINTGNVANNKKGDTLRNAALKINRNSANLLSNIEDESEFLDDALIDVAKTNVRNKFTGNIIYTGYSILTGTSVTPSFTDTTPDFHITDTGNITLNNPVNIISGKNQKGLIISDGKIKDAGDFWSFGKTGETHILGSSGSDLYTTYVYRYIQVSDTLILISLLAGY